MKKQFLTQDWTAGELNALVKKLGEKNARRLLRGELVLKTGEGGEAELAKALKKLFDRHGRRIPPKGLKAPVSDPNRDFWFKQPEIDYVARHARHTELFGDSGITVEEFRERSERLIARLKDDEQLSGTMNGVYLPVILPRLPEEFDYGEKLEELLGVVEKSYCTEFPSRKFYNHREGKLAGEVKIVHPSHEMLIETLKAEPRVGLYFPNPLQGFSVDAAREQMNDLPMDLLLSGGLDMAAAMAMYSDVLARDINTPSLDMAALSWHSSGSSLYFEAYGGLLRFPGRASLSHADGGYSAGLLLLG